MRNIITAAVDPFNSLCNCDNLDLLNSVLMSISVGEPTPVEFELVNHTSGTHRLGMLPTYGAGVLRTTCEIGNVKKRRTAIPITSYTEVGTPQFIGGERIASNFHRDTWFVEIILPLGYSEAENKTLSFLRFIRPMVYDQNTLRPVEKHLDVRIVDDISIVDSNYLYYTLLV